MQSAPTSLDNTNGSRLVRAAYSIKIETMVQGRKWGSAQISEGDALVRPNHSALSSIEWLQYKVDTTANFAS